MNSQTQPVNYQEALSIKVGRFLLMEGYFLASCRGVIQSNAELIESDSLSIAYTCPLRKAQQWLGGLIQRKARRVILGTIWFKNRDEASDQNWLIEAKGRQYVDLIMRLSQQLASTFNVTVDVRLVKEEIELEVYGSETEY